MPRTENEGRNLDEFLNAFASLSVKTKAEAYRLDLAYLRRLLFTGSSLAELEDWEPYKDPNAVKQCYGHSEAVVMVKGASVNQLRPVSEGTLKNIEDEYMREKIRLPHREDKKKKLPCPSKEAHERLLKKLANKHDYVTGKWICFISQSEVTSLWSALCRDAVNGKLPQGVFAVILGPVLVPGNPNAKRKMNERKINIKVRNVYARGMKYRIRRYLEKLDLNIDAKLKSDICTHVQVFDDTPDLHFPVSMDSIRIFKRTRNEEWKKK